MRILIVEDNDKNMQDAAAVVTAAGHEVIKARNYESALRVMGHKDVDPNTWQFIFVKSPTSPDAVLTDLFLQEKGYTGYHEVPSGILVARIAHRLSIPFVICTAGYHHGGRYNWINELAKLEGWPDMVDDCNARDAEGTKNWREALEKLLQQF